MSREDATAAKWFSISGGSRRTDPCLGAGLLFVHKLVVSLIMMLRQFPVALGDRGVHNSQMRSSWPPRSAISAAPKWQTSISHTIPDDVAIVRCCILRTPH